MKIEDIIRDEINAAKHTIESQITDPTQKAAILAMTHDLAMLPIRMAKGEDITLLMASLKAEAALRALSVSMKSQALVQQIWINIVTKVIGVALGAL